MPPVAAGNLKGSDDCIGCAKLENGLTRFEKACVSDGTGGMVLSLFYNEIVRLGLIIGRSSPESMTISVVGELHVLMSVLTIPLGGTFP